MLKIFSSLVLCICSILIFVVSPINVSAITYTNSDQVRGSNFTSRPALARALNAVFSGNASIYSDKKCTKLIDTALGTYSVPNNGIKQYVGAFNKAAKNAGTSCWIYANGVYFSLFGEALGNGTPGKNSEKINLKPVKNKTLTYENMCKWGVYNGVGAQIRVGNHSFILLGYDQNGMTYLDGNGDGKGHIAVSQLTWKQVSKTKAIKGTVRYIIQPKKSYIDYRYPCSHRFNSYNICTECSAVKAVECKTDYYGYAPVYVEGDNGASIRKSPYASCKGHEYSKFLHNGTQILIVGTVINSYENKWYVVRYAGETWYIYNERVKIPWCLIN